MKKAVALLLIFLNLFSFAAAESPTKPVPILKTFSAQDIDLNPVDESVLKGHALTMINIWGTFCNPCISEMPGLGEMHTELKERGFQIIGLLTDAQDESLSPVPAQLDFAKEIIAETKADYLHILPSPEMYYMFLSQVTAVPCTFFVDENGNMTGDVYYGSRSKETWLEIVEPLLEEVAR